MIGYIITSHVAYQHAAVPMLLQGMFEQGIGGERVVVVVNGSAVQRQFRTRGVLYLFEQPEAQAHLIPFVRDNIPGQFPGLTHWFFFNCTSQCGPRFRELVEGGYDPEADATLAGSLLHLGKRGTEGRAINDLATYRADYLMQPETVAVINEMRHFTTFESVCEWEGLVYALAPKKAHYPNVGRQILGEPQDVYGTGTPRVTEYYPAVDWYRYKRNWGQMGQATPPAAL